VTSDATTTPANDRTSSGDDEKLKYKQQQQQQCSVDDVKTQTESVTKSEEHQLSVADTKNNFPSCQFPSKVVAMSTVQLSAGIIVYDRLLAERTLRLTRVLHLAFLGVSAASLLLSV